MTDWLRLDGLSDYVAVHALQRELLEARIRGDIPDTVLLLEHAPVITVGRKRASEANVVAAGDWPVVPVERGGDVTLHVPGQLVAYPIIGLEGARRDLHRHLHALEDAVIGLCAELGVAAGRDPRNTGAWIDGRKVASIGIACRRWITWHGVAINAHVDLSAFQRINPCGFTPDVMTRLADHVACPPIAELAERFVPHLARALDIPAGPLRVTEGAE
jgi:lipoyl(octanoyl) transferase